MIAAAREAAAVLAALGPYQARIVPQVARELSRWRQLAMTIPGPALRAHALGTIEAKAPNVEATAAFATLTPRRQRAAAVRGMVALQVAIDYLDTLGEQPCEEPLRNGLQLHRALEAAVTPGAAAEDWYRLNPQGDDGGYLDRLVLGCQEAIAALPAQGAVRPLLARAARRCGEGQSHTHAAALEADSTAGDSGALAAWTAGLGAPGVYRWWEVAAGASSSVAAHALIAAAANPAASGEEAELIDCAYFPPVGALTVLLDDLVDREEDAAAAAHNYIAYYADLDEATDRLGLIVELADARLEPLHRHRRHRAILAGVLGFYLAAPAPALRLSAARLLDAAGPAAHLIAAFRRRAR